MKFTENKQFSTKEHGKSSQGGNPDEQGRSLELLQQAEFRHEERELGILFDADWYARRYLSEKLSFGRALAHFLTEGIKQFHDPNPFFFTRWYVAQANLAVLPVNILLHYIRRGAALGVPPCPLFDSPWYYVRHDVASSGLTPLSHFIQAARSGVMHDPNRFFDSALYMEEQASSRKYPHPLLHYLENARSLKPRPSEHFATQDYLLAYEDVDKSGMNPLDHYLRHGQFEGRNPKPLTVDYTEDKLRLREFRNAPADNRVVIYTAIAGDYCRLLPPAALMPGARYICFSDMPRQTYDIWTIRPLPRQFAESPRWSARWCKLHPHELFPDAETAVWMDGNIIINGDMEQYIRTALAGDSPVGMIRHPHRDCVYEEVAACLELNKDQEDRLLEQKRRYASRGLPPHGGLYETGVIINNLKHPALPALYDLWWQELSTGSFRDQVSLPYVLDRLKITPREFLPQGTSVRNCDDFIYIGHTDTFNVVLKESQFSTEVRFPERTVSFAGYCREHPEWRDAVKDHRTDVIVAVHNALEHVRACFESLLPTLRAADGLIIVNDKSDAETSDWLREFAKSDPRITLLENEQNLGYTGSANRGLRASQAPFRVMLNSDTLVPAHWLEKLLVVAYSDEKTGIVGPLSNAASYQSIPFLKYTAGDTPINTLPKGKTVADMDALCAGAAPYGAYPAVSLVHGFCLGIRQELIDKIGFFDEINFARFFGGEDDYCMRAAEAGFTLRIATPVYVFHAKSKSISKETRNPSIDRASNLLIRIYGNRIISNAASKTRHNTFLMYMRNICSTYYHFSAIEPDYIKLFNNAGFVVEKNNNYISIYNKNLIITGKSNNTLVTSHGIFIEECYAFMSQNEFVVFDIGFNIGCSSLYYALYDNIKHIYGFEPFTPTYQLGLSNLADNKKLAEKITVFNFGLGVKDMTLYRNYNEDKPGSMSSIVERFESGTVEKIIIKKATDVLMPLFKAHKENIMLKIDCEGAENDILSTMEKEKLLSCVTAISMEWHFMYPRYLLELLKRNNFFIFFNHTVHNTLGMIYAINKTQSS
jgi:FkbM family methyltransferase